MGISGAAWATIIAQLVTATLLMLPLLSAQIVGASGRTLTMSAATLNFEVFCFHHIYLISLFPNWVKANARTSTNISIAQGRNGISENVVSDDDATKSCSEQDTK